MKLSVYSIQETVFEGDVEKIIAKTPAGEITVLDEHIPLITAVRGPDCRVLEKNAKEERTILISGGFLEVRPGGAAVILASEPARQTA